jgi:mono/diheme cytochrome c family protein
MASWRGRLIIASVGAAAAAVISAMGAAGQMSDKAKEMHPSGQPAAIRMTMEELHAQGGVPRGWKFTLPAGDVATGRQVFIGLECFACHEVGGESFPRDSKTPRAAGPALTGMGSHHPAEYLAESILSPNRVIILGPGYTGADGLSRMPSYADSMTAKELIDVVAYLRSLTDAGHGGHHMHRGGAPATGGTTKGK